MEYRLLVQIVFKVVYEMPFDGSQHTRGLSSEPSTRCEIDQDGHGEVGLEQGQRHHEEQIDERVVEIDEDYVDDGDANVEQEEDQVQRDGCDSKLAVFDCLLFDFGVEGAV